MWDMLECWIDAVTPSGLWVSVMSHYRRWPLWPRWPDQPFTPKLTSLLHRVQVWLNKDRLSQKNPDCVTLTESGVNLIGAWCQSCSFPSDSEVGDLRTRAACSGLQLGLPSSSRLLLMCILGSLGVFCLLEAKVCEPPRDQMRPCQNRRIMVSLRLIAAVCTSFFFFFFSLQLFCSCPVCVVCNTNTTPSPVWFLQPIMVLWSH